MKTPLFFISLAASGLSLILSIVLFIYGGMDQSLQTEIQKQQQDLQKQQEQINTGNSISNDVGPKLLQDMARVSIKDEQMRALLAKHGYTVNYQPPASPAPGAAGASPAPAHASSPAPAASPNPHP